MKKNNFFLFLFFIALLIGCSKEKIIENKINEKSLDLQILEAYSEGMENLEDGDVLFAAKNFNAAENIFPQSIWAPRSILMAAYSYYTQDYYGDAISETKRFIRNYPRSKNISYAYFLLASCYYELIIDEKKDLSPLLESKKYFKIIMNEYPETDFALDAKFKVSMINNILASKEVYIGKYYIQKEKWIAAINRFKNVVTNYSETEYVEEALHRLVELNYKIGLEGEAKNYAALLGYNYQSGEWYKESYKIFNKEYEDPKKKIKKEKKFFSIKKIQSLF